MRRDARQFAGFVFAGACGFLADVAVLYLAIAAGAGPYLGRVFSFAAAVTLTWFINRRLTFGTSGSFARYVVLMLGGLAVNFAAYSVALHWLPAAAWAPGLAAAVGSGAGLVVNFLSAKYLVFKA